MGLIPAQRPLSNLALYELARTKSLNGEMRESEEIIASNIRNQISTLPFKSLNPKSLGSHGDYRAELSDGTLVLVKPHVDELVCHSIPKEVGLSIYSSLIGFYL